MRLLICLFYFIGTFAWGQPALRDEIGRLMQREWDQYDFSGVLLVAKEGKPVYYKAKGYRRFQGENKLKKTDLFEWASVSKQFTSMVILQLKEAGKLNYEDSLGKFIPGLPYHGITIRHLLTHTSGIPDYQEIMDQHWDKSKIAGNADVISYLKQYPRPMLFQPGSKYAYSNTGYLLLSSIAEVASGQHFIKWVHDRIFGPLKMKGAGFRNPGSRSRIKNFAWGHIYEEDKKRYTHADSFPSFNYTIWLGERTGPGRISGSALDLLKWDRALYTGKLVSQKILKEAFQPFVLSDGGISHYGFGWALRTHPTLGRVVHHSGDNPGYRTHIVRYIDKNYTVILLNNSSSSRMEHILEELEGMLGEELRIKN